MDVVERYVYLGEQRELADSRRCYATVTPNEEAAGTLGVPPLSLEGLALETLGQGRVAHHLLVQRLMRRVVEGTLGSLDSAGIARTLLPIVRELFRADANLNVVPSSPRARRALMVTRQYRELLRQQNLVDPAEVLHEAARLSTRRRPVRVFGYPRLGHDEVAFLDAIAGEGSAVHLPYAEDSLFAENLEAAKELEERGWKVEIAPTPEPWSPRLPASAHVYPHLEAEVRGVLAQVKILLTDGASPDDLVVVVRDDAFYGPTVLSVAREYGVPVQALYRIPVAETRVGHWLHLLLETTGGGYQFEPTARLLAHPLGPGMLDKDWSAVRKARPHGRADWSEVGVDLPETWPHAWPPEDSRAGWVARFDALLDGHRFGQKTRPWRGELAALANLKEAAGWLAEPKGEVISRDDFLRELEELLFAVTTLAHPEGEGVALHTPLSLFGARYRHVFVLGLVEGSFPAPASDDPALDFHERKKLRSDGIRLELADERARRERLSF